MLTYITCFPYKQIAVHTVLFYSNISSAAFNLIMFHDLGGVYLREAFYLKSNKFISVLQELWRGSLVDKH